MKNILVLLSCLLLTISSYAQSFPADADTISSTTLHSEKVNKDIQAIDSKILIKTGMLWGFIKYHHPAVRRGNFNMDAELYRLLPQLTGISGSAADKVLETWLDHFGSVDTTLAENANTGKIKLAPDYGYLFSQKYFPASVIKKLERIKTCRKPDEDYYIAYTIPVGNPLFTHEQAYTDYTCPDAGIRLLSLFRYWNMIQNFYPNRHLIGFDWNAILTDFIPVFLACHTDEEYFKACVRIVSRINDTHAQVRGQNGIYERTFGTNTIPLTCYFIEGQLLVTHVPDTLGLRDKIQKGDIITAINNVGIQQLADRYAPLMSCSNNSIRLWKLSDIRSMLFCNKDTTITLAVKRADKSFSVTLKKIEISNYYYRKPLSTADSAFKLLPGNIGYIFPGLLGEADLKEAKEKLNDTKGLIIDMRCYPKTFIPYSITDWLKKEYTSFSVATRIDINTPGLFTLQEEMKCGTNKENCYKGKVVVIVNPKTISQSEFTTMAIQSATNTYTIGDTTAGADGNISIITLPGAVNTVVSGLGILYPDGRETQRIGVKIDHIVMPTIHGVMAGEDELLTAAIKHIND